MNISEIERKVASHIAGCSHLVVAFSGGLDSSVLLHLLVRLREHNFPYLKIRAVHVRHELDLYSEEEWVAHCDKVCDQWRVPLQVLTVTVNPSQGGIEAAARQARYRVLQSVLDQHEILLTAQHLDDQCETFLLALKRGSGPAGLSAMAYRMPFFHTEQLRPLLDINRQQLQDYAAYYQLNWVEDESNDNDRFDRNFLRLRIIPALRDRWPYFTQSVARSAGLCAEQEQLLDELLLTSLNELIAEDHSVNIEGLAAMSKIKRYALLRRWIARFGVMMPTREQLQRLWFEVALARDDAEPQLRFGTIQIRRFRKRLYLLPLLHSLRSEIIPWDPNYPLQLPEGIGIIRLGEEGVCVRAPQADEKVSIRFYAKGRLRIMGRDHSCTVKKIWQQYHIPPWERERIPMIYYNECLIAALGVYVTQDGSGAVEEPVWRIHWVKD